MQDISKLVELVFVASSRWQCQKPMKHCRHHMRVGNVVFFHQPQRFFWIPLVHQHGADTCRQRRNNIKG